MAGIRVFGKLSANMNLPIHFDYYLVPLLWWYKGEYMGQGFLMITTPDHLGKLP